MFSTLLLNDQPSSPKPPQTKFVTSRPVWPYTGYGDVASQSIPQNRGCRTSNLKSKGADTCVSRERLLAWRRSCW